jgi:hypothetical protein
MHCLQLPQLLTHATDLSQAAVADAPPAPAATQAAAKPVVGVAAASAPLQLSCCSQRCTSTMPWGPRFLLQLRLLWQTQVMPECAPLILHTTMTAVWYVDMQITAAAAALLRQQQQESARYRGPCCDMCHNTGLVHLSTCIC